jgi:hypothetical protein
MVVTNDLLEVDVWYPVWRYNINIPTNFAQKNILNIRRNACKTLVKDLEGRDHFRDLDVDERIILKWILKIIGCEGVY